MRVAMVSQFPSQARRVAGGVAGAAKALADELARRPGMELVIVVPYGAPGSETVRGTLDGLTVYRLAREGPFRRAPGTLYDILAGRRQLERLWRRLRPDVVHFQGSSLLALGCRRPSVLTVHGLAEKDAAWDKRWGLASPLKRAGLTWSEAEVRRRAANVILISEFTAGFFRARPGRRTWRIPNPVPASFFAVKRRTEPGRVLFCGRVTPLKNVAGLIAAFAAVAARRPEARLRVAGPAEAAYLDECRRAAGGAGLEGRVDFLGPLETEALQGELAAAACLVQPSFQENAPLSVAEAQAAGLPVVASRVGALPEMLEGGQAGLLVEPRDGAGLAGAILRLLEDEALAEELSRRGRAAAERHRACVVAERTLDVYRALAGAAEGEPT